MCPEDFAGSTLSDMETWTEPAENTDARWRQEYENLIRKMGLTVAPGPATGKDRREHPRVTLPRGAAIYAHGSPQRFEIHDLSAGGLSFYSDHHIQAGSRLILSALGLLALEVDVVGCDMEEVDPNLMDFRYRVRCKFAEKVNGFQAFILARELFMKQ
jgi:c-di-GMP-binding flagellar brake protein YcgR